MVALCGGGSLLSRARSSSGSLLLLHHRHSVFLGRTRNGFHRGLFFCPNSRPPACRDVPATADRCSLCGPLRPLVLRVPFCSSTEPPLPALEKPSKVPGGPKISFCPACGGATEHRIPQGEEKPRAVCSECGRIHYENPKMVVGCIVVHEEKVLLCKRSIEPSYGLWTLPAGYLELGESATEGAIRETWEEANADVDVQAPFAQLDIPQIGQSYIIFRAKLKTPHFSPGSESLECALFKLEDIPFDQLAFSSIRVALKLYVEDFKAGSVKVHHGVIEKRPGTAPSDPSGYTVRDHICT